MLPRNPAAATGADAQIWLAQAEGGEGGEAGAVAGAEPDLAYLTQLEIVEGHLVAAAQLYAKGQINDAIGLSYHPEAEMMDEMRAKLAAHGAADFTPQMQAFSAAMEAGASPAEVDAALAGFRAAVAAAKAPEADELRLRFDAIVLLLKAAASEYAGSIEDGKVADPLAYQEAWAFLGIAREEAGALTAMAKTSSAATRALAAMAGADEAFGDMTGTDLTAADPAILLAVAAKVELIASSVR